MTTKAEFAKRWLQGDEEALEQLLPLDAELLARHTAFKRQADADHEVRMNREDWFDTMLQSTPEADELYAAVRARLEQIAEES